MGNRPVMGGRDEEGNIVIIEGQGPTEVINGEVVEKSTGEKEVKP
jgi:hypothetical protein